MRPDHDSHRLHRLVRRTPGCTVQEAVRILGIHRSRVLRSLTRLESQDHVRVFQMGQRKHILPAVPGVEEGWRQALVLRDRFVAAFHHAMGRGVHIQRKLAALGARIDSWSTTKTQRILHALEEVGLVERFKRHPGSRETHYRAKPHHPSVSEMGLGLPAGPRETGEPGAGPSPPWRRDDPRP